VLLKHELAYCLGQMQNQTAIRSFFSFFCYLKLNLEAWIWTMDSLIFAGSRVKVKTFFSFPGFFLGLDFFLFQGQESGQGPQPKLRPKFLKFPVSS